MTQEQTALITMPQDVDRYLPRAIMELPEYHARLVAFRKFVDTQMVKDVDYGNVPGSDKPSLFQPGAQKLCEMYALAPIPTLTRTVEQWDVGFFFFEAKVDLVMKSTGVTVASGIGSCNSKEDKYAWRWVGEKQIPSHLDKAELRQKMFENKATGAKWSKWRIPNEDPFTLVNTFQKMAVKRALVAATLMATRSSGIFTQDVEDMRDNIIDSSATYVENGQPVDHRKTTKNPGQKSPRRPPRQEPPQPAVYPPEPGSHGPHCSHPDCRTLVEDWTAPDGRVVPWPEVVRATAQGFHRTYCGNCAVVAKLHIGQDPPWPDDQRFTQARAEPPPAQA